MTTLLNDEISAPPVDAPLLQVLNFNADGDPLGCQTPRYFYGTDGDPGPGEDAIDLAYEFGLELDEWQQFVLREALRERPSDGKWSAFEVGLMVSRQNGKGSILEAMELAALLLFGERRILHTAHLFQTALDGQRRLHELLDKRPDIVKHKAVGSHGHESVELTSGPNKGAKVEFMTRTKGGGLGLPVDRIIFDEAMFISPESYQALLPTLAARPNTQVWLTGSAVDQRIHIGCEQFTGLRHRGLNSEPGKRICYIEWSVPDDARASDPNVWALANPSLGSRLTIEDTQAEYDAFMSAGGERAFGVQRLGIGDWPLLGAARSEIPMDLWRNLRDPSPELVGSSVLTLYRAPEGGPWSIAAAQRSAPVVNDKGELTSGGRIHLEVRHCGDEPADVVVDKFVQAVTAFAPAAVIVGRGGAAAATPKLEAAGIIPVTPSLMEEAQACGGFLDDALAAEPLLSHADQAGLTRGAGHSTKKDLPSGGFVWEINDESTYPQLMAATLSHWALLKFGGNTVTEPTVYAWPTQEEIDEFLAKEAL